MSHVEKSLVKLISYYDLINATSTMMFFLRILLVNRNPALGAYMRQIYRDLLYQDNTLVITTAYGAVV